MLFLVKVEFIVEGLNSKRMFNPTRTKFILLGNHLELAGEM